MPIIRRRLQSSDVHPDDIRYHDSSDTVQRFLDGEWKDAPESDPRQLITLPPRTTSDPKCDSAASVSAALAGQIGEVITGIENGMTALQIAGLILGLFSFGVFAIFINIALFIADLMLDAGASVLDAALTPAVYDELTCALYCNMDSQGRIDQAGLDATMAQVTTNVGGIGAVVLNSMLALAGFGGVSNLGAAGTETGDCSECDCDTEWCYLHDFTVTDSGFEPDPLNTVDYGIWEIITGWTYTDATNVQTGITTGNRLVRIKRTFTSVNVTKIIVTYDYTGGTYDNTSVNAFDLTAGGVNRIAITRAAMTNGTNLTQTWTTAGTMIDSILLGIRSSRDITSPYAYSGNVRVISIQVEGTGVNPFGDDNCEPG